MKKTSGTAAVSSSPMAISVGESRLSLPVEVFLLLCFSSYSLLFVPTGAFDPLDPNANITIKWDVLQYTDAGYSAMVTMYNYQLYRHIERPGWKLGWEWPGDEVIWDVRGAEATEQGNCSKFKGELPHCCAKKPVIVDLLPGAPYNYQVSNCCKAGVLSSMTQDPSKYAASFQLSIGNTPYDPSQELPNPDNFTLGLPGYTCGSMFNATASKFPSTDKRRKTQALRTWKVTCSYSQIRASPSPTCCVSLSAFYNDTIVECPRCSCACQDAPSTNKCARAGEQASFLQLPQDELDHPPTYVRCTEHMCPIQVHWHVKVSYREYWRVKVTVTNYNLVRNYSEWNLVAKHPNFESLTQVFSFNHEALDVYGRHNDTVMFWGIQYYNDMLLQYGGGNGNVQSEMLLHKDPGEFTFRAGWAFPRRIVFNGEDCVMPPPDMYPRLPNNSSPRRRPSAIHLLLPLLLLVCLGHLLEII